MQLVRLEILQETMPENFQLEDAMLEDAGALENLQQEEQQRQKQAPSCTHL